MKVVVILLFLAVLVAFHWWFAACTLGGVFKNGEREFDEPPHDPAFALHPEKQFK